LLPLDIEISIFSIFEENDTGLSGTMIFSVEDIDGNVIETPVTAGISEATLVQTGIYYLSKTFSSSIYRPHKQYFLIWDTDDGRIAKEPVRFFKY
jgi:hypothetical protein